MTYMIETKNLTKTFKKEKVLDQVFLHVPENSVYGLLGPNGAGKSTLMKLLTGVLKPTSGQIFVQGHSFQAGMMKEVGAMIEGPAIYENLTAYENLTVLALLLKIPKSRIPRILETVGLTETGKKQAQHFSLGMKQRLGIAMALLNEPKLLILDEPTNGLDPIGIQDLRELIRSFPQKGMTVILSSHVLSEVQQVADHVGIIAQGHLDYEAKNDPNKHDLETVFMNVVRKNQEGSRH